jgi:hypothetical protein
MKSHEIAPLAVVAWLMTCTIAWAAPDAGPLRTLMDKAALTDGWTRAGNADFFDKKTLFNLVDGEAEAYFPYGFEGVVSVRYAKRGDNTKTASVELYAMGSLLDAYGIYSSKREVESKRVNVGAEGFGGATQVMFYVDKYFVKATLDLAAAGELSSFVKAVARELPADTKKPGQLSLVAIPGVVPQSDQYIGQSVLGYACWPKGIMAQVKTKETPARVFVVITNSSADATTALDKYVKEIADVDIKYVDDGGQKVLTLIDPMHKGVAVSQAGKYLIGAADLEDPEKQGLPLVKQLRLRVRVAGK